MVLGSSLLSIHTHVNLLLLCLQMLREIHSSHCTCRAAPLHSSELRWTHTTGAYTIRHTYRYLSILSLLHRHLLPPHVLHLLLVLRIVE